MFSRRAVVILTVAFGLEPSRAAADDALPEPSYLWDGGAIPFIWGALGARLTIDHYATPRRTPLMFSAEEGGEPAPAWEVPGWIVTAGGGVLAGAMLAGGDRSRWYHVKGLAQSLSTGVTLTAALKVSLGRHRPAWDPATDRDADRRSFPSGHTTQAFAIATYASAYLRRHVFDASRTGGEWPAYELVTYAALYVGAAAVAAERVIHNQHHVSDVVAGAALGTATSLLFFRYQERRYRDGTRTEHDPYVVPAISAEGGAGVRVGWHW
jgi:membrane-associated phospholipid phosphatase